MVLDLYKRCLEKLAYRYWTKNKDRSSEQNWKLAEKFMERIHKRYKIDRR